MMNSEIDCDGDEYAEQPEPEISSELDDLRTQLGEYKVLAQSLEKRIMDLHRECEKKDAEIAMLKEGGLQSSSTERVGGETQSELDMEDSTILRKMFVGGLNAVTTSESLKEYFTQFGEVIHCMVMKDTNTNRPRGFGFVVFASSAGVDAAQAARPHTVDGKVVDTKRAQPKGEPVNNPSGEVCKRVFIGGLKTTTENSTLLNYFSQYGAVEHVDIPEDKVAKRKRGFAYVTFTDFDPVDKVTIIKFHTIDGRRCEVKKAVTREEMESMKARTGEPGASSAPAYGGYAPPQGPPGENHGDNYWNQAPAAYAPPPPAQPFRPPYAFSRPSGVHPPVGVPPYPHRPQMPVRPPVRGYPPAPWPNNNGVGRVGPVRGKPNHLLRSAGPYGGGYGLRSS